jgi:hypothetical protein
MGEETRHSRLFVRLLTQIRPEASNPLDNWFVRKVERIVLPFLMSMPALFCLPHGSRRRASSSFLPF